MLWFIFTTGTCNLKCKYCGGSFPEDIVPRTPRYRIEDLINFLKRDSNRTIFFYGGEPLLNIDFIKEVIENLNAKRYGIQTNGLLLNRLDNSLLNKFDVILVSIDGIEEVTDKYRGKGVYKKVVENIKKIREKFNGEIIARMTITEDSDIFRDVMHLINLKLFDKIHWQLNVIWTERWNFEKWSENYIKGIKNLVKYFLEKLKRGKIIKLIPIIGIISSFFKPFNHVPCGSGKYSFSILTDGRVIACPIAVYESWANVGNIFNGNIKKLNLKPPCYNCDYFIHCGGRCLYSNYERLWGEEGFKNVCKVTIRTIEIIKRIIPEIFSLIDKGIIKFKDLCYNPLKDSTEVIP